MTQAFNLSQFANKLNTSGQTNNTGLQNSSVTVTAGTGLSGGGAVALGASISLANAGVTSVAAGTGISVSASTGGVTISSTVTGGVTSVSGGNGISSSGGTAPSISAACPTYNTVGSYCFVSAFWGIGDTAISGGQNVGAGSGGIQALAITTDNNASSDLGWNIQQTNLSGTWKWMGATTDQYSNGYLGLACRVS